MQSSADGNNYKVFRYADALLMMAECYFYKENYEKGGRIPRHDPHARANLSKYTFRTPARLEGGDPQRRRARELSANSSASTTWSAGVSGTKP